MNITISRRSRSFNLTTNARYNSVQLDNQYLAATCCKQLNKNSSLNKPAHEEEPNTCTNWLFSRCFKKPSNVDEESHNKKFISLQKAKEIRHISGKQKIKQFSKTEAHKIDVLLKKGSNFATKSHNKIKITCNAQPPNETKVCKQTPQCLNYGQNLNKNEQQKLTIHAFKSSDNIHQASSENIKYRLNEFSLKPSTVTSVNNISSQKQKSSPSSKLKLSNNFQSIMATDTKPFGSAQRHQEQIKPADEVSNKGVKQISEEPLQDHLSRFLLISPSDNEFKISDPEKSNRSINTSYIRKRIQFSSELSDRTKLQNYIYQPVYLLNTKQFQMSYSKSHKNAYSQLIKTINVDDQHYFDSAKPHSQESMVLQKGLHQIFHLPTFQNLDEVNSKEIVEIQRLVLCQSFCKHKKDKMISD